MDDTQVSTDAVSLGHVVRVLDMEYDEEDEYTIVGFTEADPLKLFISNESPIGMALVDPNGTGVGAHVGDIVEAEIISIDEARNRIGLSLKRLEQKKK